MEDTIVESDDVQTRHVCFDSGKKKTNKNMCIFRSEKLSTDKCRNDCRQQRLTYALFFFYEHSSSFRQNPCLSLLHFPTAFQSAVQLDKV